MLGAPRASVGRFDLIRQIGEGGFGVVFEAYDREHEARVALKLLRRANYAALYGFKQEFRALADVFHPNLVRLHELANDGDAWYFTMELVEGVSFVDYVLGRQSLIVPRTVTDSLVGPKSMSQHVNDGALDFERLLDATAQLTEGLLALHAHGKLHRDVKPSNVLVDGDGRVVLLDFGLVTDLGAHSGGARSGTPGYMSPEQAAGQPLGAASDWYALGAMLHEVLTGSTPAAGAPALSNLAPEFRALGAVCSELLHPEPEHRLHGSHVLERLRREAPETSTSEAPSDSLIGREDELSVLRGALQRVTRGDALLLRVVGRSGIGKSKLLETFLTEAQQRQPELLVLKGRCYEHETVPYKALDSLVDTLGRHVVAHQGGMLLALATTQRELLARLFRVFEDGAQRPRMEIPTSQAQRSLAYSALRDLIHELSRGCPVVLFVDDVQWGDADSARLLAEIIRPPFPERLLVITSSRPDQVVGFQESLDEAQLEIEQLVVTLQELSAGAALELAGHLLPNSRKDVIDAIAAESSGSPLLLQQLAHQALNDISFSNTGDSVDAIVCERVSRLPASVQNLLELVAVAGRPIQGSLAASAAMLDRASMRGVQHAAARTFLLTLRSTAGGIALELSHDRVREAVLGAMTSERSGELHRRLADVLLEQPRPDVDALVRHLSAAGDRAQTRKYCVLAVQKAEDAFAFERAAQHLATLINLSDTSNADHWQLLKRRGEALSNAGRAAEASEVFLDTASLLRRVDSNHPQAAGLSRRSAELALRSGRLEVGAERMKAVLEREGVSIPASRSKALALSSIKRLRFLARGLRFADRPPATVTPQVRSRLDALWGASTSLSMTNYVIADSLGVSYLLQALKVGNQSDVVRGLGYEAAFEAVIGGSFFRRRCAQMLQSMDEMAERSGEPYDKAWAQMARGITLWYDGDWEATFRHCTSAAAEYRENCHGAVWEQAVCDAYRLPSLAYLGDLTKLSQLVPRALMGARERGDMFAAATLRMGQENMLFLKEDLPDQARHEASEAISAFPKGTYLLPHYHYLLAMTQADLYEGRGRDAFERVTRDQVGLTESRLSSARCLRVEIRQLSARAALAFAQAPEGAWSEGRLHKHALTLAVKIERDGVRQSAPFAAAIRAGVANARGDRTATIGLLGEALRSFQAANMRLYAEAARFALGEVEGGSRGAEQSEVALRWLRSHRVKNPLALIRMLLPSATRATSGD